MGDIPSRHEYNLHAKSALNLSASHACLFYEPEFVHSKDNPLVQGSARSGAHACGRQLEKDFASLATAIAAHRTLLEKAARAIYVRFTFMVQTFGAYAKCSIAPAMHSATSRTAISAVTSVTPPPHKQPQRKPPRSRHTVSDDNP